MASQPHIQNLKPSEIEPYYRNPRKNEQAILKVAESIQTFGFNQPIVIDTDNIIIVGHTRWKAALKLDLGTVPVIQVDLDEDKAKAYRIADNRVAEESEWDFELLQDEFADLPEDLFTGFEPDELANLFEMNGEAEEDNYTVPDEDDIETDIQLGDLITIGRHRLLCGDSTDAAQVEYLMDGKKADMVFTDPPYLRDFTGGIHADGSKSYNSKHGRIKNDKMSKQDGEDFLDAINANISLFVTGAFYITFHRLGIGDYFSSFKRTGLECRSLIIWEKGNHTLSNSDYMSRYEPIFYGWVDKHNFYGGKNGMDVWFIERTKKNELHPTMKPIELCAKAIEDGSKNKEKVLDLFLGSGSTMVAAHQLNRTCYGMELDPKYCQVIVDRMLALDATLPVTINEEPYKPTHKKDE